MGLAMIQIRPLHRLVASFLIGGLLSAASPQGDGNAPGEVKMPSLVYAQCGGNALLRGFGGEGVGTIEDYLVDRRSGRLVAVVVAPRGMLTAVRVPFSSFQEDELEQVLRVPFGLEELRAYPAWEPPTPKRQTQRGMKPRAVPSTLLASTILARPVWAKGENFGRARSLLIDVGTGTVAYLLVEERLSTADPGDPFVVPYRATEWRVGEVQAADGLALRRSSLELVRAPRLEAMDLSALGSRTVGEDIQRFYRLEQTAKL